MHLDLGVGHLGDCIPIIIPCDNCSKMQSEFEDAFWAKRVAKWWFKFENGLLFFFKCINTYIEDVSIAFSFNTLQLI